MEIRSTSNEMEEENGERGKIIIIEQLEAQTQVWNHSLGYIHSMAVQCAIELGIPDAVHAHRRPISTADLAAALQISPAKAPFLRRLMRLLVHLAYFTSSSSPADEEEGGTNYSVGPLCGLLLKTNSFNASSLVLTANHPNLVDPWRNMSSWFRHTGDDQHSPFAFSNGGKRLYQVAAEDPVFAKLMNEGMAGDSWLVGRALVAKCRGSFEGLTSLVDVGGNTGTTAKAIAEAFPGVECTVFDLPHVVGGELEGCGGGGKVGNLKYVSGDMFVGIPSADAVLLKWVLVDWDDESCLKILKQCKKAVTKEKKDGKAGKVMIADHILGHPSCSDRASTETLLLFDMADMAAFEGSLRTEREWAKLFHRAGFSNYTITPLAGLRCLIEVYP